MSSNINFGERRSEKKALGAKKSGLRAATIDRVEVNRTTSTNHSELEKTRNIEIPEKATAKGYSMYPSSKELLTKMRIEKAPRLSDAKYLQNLIFKDAFGKELFDRETGQADINVWKLLKDL